MTENVIGETKPSVTSSVERNISVIIVLLSISSIICFFLPWLNLLGNSASGFELVKREGAGVDGWLLLLVPGIALMTIVIGLIKPAEARAAGLIAGFAPIVA